MKLTHERGMYIHILLLPLVYHIIIIIYLLLLLYIYITLWLRFAMRHEFNKKYYYQHSRWIYQCTQQLQNIYADVIEVESQARHATRFK